MTKEEKQKQQQDRTKIVYLFNPCVCVCVFILFPFIRIYTDLIEPYQYVRNKIKEKIFELTSD